MRYALTAAFLLAAVLLPASCESREGAIYAAESAAALQNQVPQADPQHYPVQQGHGQPGNYLQYAAQQARQLQKEEEISQSNLTLRPQVSARESQEEKIRLRNMMLYQQMMMRQAAQRHHYAHAPPHHHHRPNMMNVPHNMRHAHQFPPKLTMEQQMQMQMQMQLQRQQMQQIMQQRMLAAAQAQALMLQQQRMLQAQAQRAAQQTPQHVAQPAPHQVQPTPQQYVQHYQQHAPVAAQALLKQPYPVPGATPQARYAAPQARYAAPPTTGQQPQAWPQAQQQPQQYYEGYGGSQRKE